jgi:hypothetical protein
MSGAPQIVVRTPGALTAKPIALNASPKWPDVKDDYVVRYDGHLVGRMRLGGERYSHGTTWEWSITVPMDAGLGERDRGKPRCVHEGFHGSLGKVSKGDQSGTPRSGLGAGASVRGTLTKARNEQNGRSLERRYASVRLLSFFDARVSCRTRYPAPVRAGR